jgi:Kdo2-lipid IVA lauroyltransferase/acyltransferase
MLVDQHYARGVEVSFFGGRCLANPLIAQLAAQTACPIRGSRVVRNPDGNSFWAEITEPIEPVRGPEGRVNSRHHAGDHVGHRRLGARA